VCCLYCDALPWLRLPALPIDVDHRRCIHLYEAANEGIVFSRRRVKQKTNRSQRNFIPLFPPSSPISSSTAKMPRHDHCKRQKVLEHMRNNHRSQVAKPQSHYGIHHAQTSNQHNTANALVDMQAPEQHRSNHHRYARRHPRRCTRLRSPRNHLLQQVSTKYMLLAETSSWLMRRILRCCRGHLIARLKRCPASPTQESQCEKSSLSVQHEPP